MENSIKFPNVAGSFYPSDSNELNLVIDNYLLKAKKLDFFPKAIIAPHAGYIYSGEIAASAYAQIKNSEKIKKVAIFSPAHRYPVSGVATHSAQYFSTPLGNLKVDLQAIKELEKFEFINQENQAFVQEHALEVHLPFIQKVFTNAKILPFIVGNCSQQNSHKLMQTLLDQNVFLIISSDLSHFHPDGEAQEIDLKTSSYIENLQAEKLSSSMACGVYPLIGIIELARANKLKILNVDLRNSGHTAGDKDSVVGYGSFIIY